MKKKHFRLMIFLIMLLNLTILVNAQEDVEINFFYSNTCPHCKAEMEFLKSLENKCLEIKVNYYEAGKNQELLSELSQKYNTTTFAVPRTFIGDKAYIGFSSEDGELEFHPVYKAYTGYANVIESQINELRGISTISAEENETCEPEPISELGKEKNENSWIFIIILIYCLVYFFLRKTFKLKRRIGISGLILVIIICFFIFFSSQSEVSIKTFAEKFPFPFFVTIIALADGFNPCAFTVLIILLSLLTYTKSKRDMGIIGFTFIITSALMYFIFIMFMVIIGSWVFEKYGQVILFVLGIIITLAGLINIKDFFFFKKGVSLTISDKEKLSITKKARKIVNQLKDSTTKKGFFLALIGTIMLAVFVNMVELGCTAILPAVYMASLIKSFGESIAIPHIIWTLYYSFIYILPLLAIMLVFIFTFRSTRITEKQGRILKLVSGLFMLGFGLIMLLKPELLVFG
ncbi:glutaredoxin family protein [Candidatus Woesearchaeota archaeon]|nr:glutaredoxin family protein [Candidatus Woesearchaeota archaeon]